MPYEIKERKIDEQIDRWIDRWIARWRGRERAAIACMDAYTGLFVQRCANI